jgi:murein peptide amidase A
LSAAPPGLVLMQRLGLNVDAYKGETINITQVLYDIEQLAATTGWERDPINVTEKNLLPAFRRLPANPRRQIYLSSGMHGDEPAGPLAVLELFRQNRWPDDLGLWIIPCLNPSGFLLNRRENADGVDLNRDYRALKTDVVRAHVAWLNQRPRFDLTLLLHEDWESSGFYLYELNPQLQPSISEAIIKKVKEVCPIDTSPVIEGRPARNGIICANPDLMKRLDWPEAFYLVHHKTPISYTLEGPSDFSLSTRVKSLVAGVRAAFDLCKRGNGS